MKAPAGTGRLKVRVPLKHSEFTPEACEEHLLDVMVQTELHHELLLQHVLEST